MVTSPVALKSSM